MLVSLPLTVCLSMLRLVRAGSYVRLDGEMLMGDCLLPYNGPFILYLGKQTDVRLSISIWSSADKLNIIMYFIFNIEANI